MAKIRLSSAGMAALLKSDDVRSFLTERAQRVASAAKAGAPVASGEYQNSIHLEQATTDRAVVRVVADAEHALIVEARTGNLSRALDAAGGA